MVNYSKEYSMEQTPEISVVLPIYNEKGNIEPLVKEIIAALEPTGRMFEILCVDDGSKDESLSTILSLAEKDKRIVALSHKKNFGQSAAQATGFAKARGEILVTLDADGQNNPADIPRLLALLPENDCACGIRAKRRDTWIRKLSSRIANRVRNWITGVTDFERATQYDKEINAYMGRIQPTDIMKSLLAGGEDETLISPTPNKTTSPFPDYPDAYQENGNWYVIKDGKRYRIQE